MSIASEITRISGNVADAYTAANAKGATMPVTQNSDNLATTISTIQTGTTPTGTKSITENGVYDVTDFASADVQVPTTAPAYYIEKTKDANGVAQNGSYLMDFSTFTDIGNYVFQYAYFRNTSISGTVDMSGLTQIYGTSACNSMFYYCTNITGIDLSNLKNVEGENFFGYAFYGCSQIPSVDLGKLVCVIGTSATSQMFRTCSGIQSINISSLVSIKGNTGCAQMFNACTGLTSVNLSSLTNAEGSQACQGMFANCSNIASADISHLAKVNASSSLQSMFSNCTSLTELRFSGLPYTTTNINGAFVGMLQGVTGCTVHFPSDWQTAMASYSNITNGLGGTNTTVLFDLPAVTTLDLSYITEIVGNNQFYQFAYNNYFPNVTGFNLSNLTTISGQSACQNMFSSCTGLTSVDLSGLTTIGGTRSCSSMFANCSNITSVNLSSLKEISGNLACTTMFYGCTGITELRFPSLTTVVDSGVFTNMLNGTTGITVHFPSNFATTVTAATLGGTNTTVLYDLPATA